MTREACVLAIVVLASAIEYAQPSQPPIVRATATGVVIDVTVVDSKGQPVLDLTPADFEVKDEGKIQQVLSVTLVQGGVVGPLSGSTRPDAAQSARSESRGAPVGAPASAAEIQKTPTVTAILFDRLSHETRALARDAALAYVGTLAPPHDYAGIFLADLKLAVFQPFTNDAESLRTAVHRIAETAPTNLLDAQLFRSKRLAAMDPDAPVTAGAEYDSGWVNVGERERRLAQGDLVEQLLARMELRMERTYRQFAEEYGGHASIAGLRTAIDGLATLQGRKSIMYFTEKLSITAQQKSKVEALIGEANRANVTFYPVDAAGLRVHSEEAKVGRNVELAGAQGIGDTRRDDGGWTKELERQEQLLSSRPSAALGRLAKETGGFLIENTNNLAAGVARMQQERTTYYLVGYQPANATMDGKFRKVSVKVKRPKVTVRARPGYLAVPVSAQ
jgi:VWFA-related protein